MKHFHASILVGLTLFLCFQITSRAAEVTVFAAASLTDSLRNIAAAYEKQGGDHVVFNFAASSTLARQIGEGAPADLFFSADEAKMDALEAKGLVFKTTRRSLLGNSLVVVVAADHGAAITNLAGLAGPGVKRLALGDPKAVPAGIYARELLEKQKLWDAVEPKVVPMENVRAALAVVESGDADAAIVYKTDAAISKKVAVAVEVPREQGPVITYPVALLTTSPQPEAARKFLKYLESNEAGAAFRRYGFVTLPAAGK